MSVSLLLPLLTFFFIVAVARVKPEYKGYTAAAAVFLSAILSSWIAIRVLNGFPYSEFFQGGTVFGNISVRLDGVSAWFILLTNFTAITAILYGRNYLKHYRSLPSNLSLHYAGYLLNHFALTGIYFIQNSLAFLCFWEITALSAFILVIFEHGRMESLKAGINYLIQSHISILFLTVGFIWVYASTGSFEFTAIRDYCISAGKEASLLLFFVFFIGFAIKAGFVPFHTWLPHAHPAAPSHVSGLMSGVLIKTGIYGILRMLLLMPDNHLVLGYILLLVSVVSGVYGVLLATIQHNIKKLLAYHSIENIGIIGIGMGIGAIGDGLGIPHLAFAGYAGALLHTLNHSLYKSLLFYAAGTVYTATHTLNIDRMGGLIKKLPHTSLLFLVAALAICGLPPFNGFISEFLIYSGLFNAIAAGQAASVIILAIVGLALIGGLALMCFTKAFGIMFLGTNRSDYPPAVQEAGPSMLVPMYLTVLLIAAIGLLPQWFVTVLQIPLRLFTEIPDATGHSDLVGLMQKISLAAAGMILLSLSLFLIRKAVTQRIDPVFGPTWGCGYKTDSPRLQYTASSFVRPYANLIKPWIVMSKTQDEIKNIFPKSMHTESHFHDKIERGLIDWPVRNLRGFLGKFKFLQNGSVQFYVLYGVVFIAISIAIPLVIRAIQYLSQLIKQL
jgi:formate hydrogenlyase subunit 3/multisubunit Na+/H+ antiporter MnhD subunit